MVHPLLGCSAGHAVLSAICGMYVISKKDVTRTIYIREDNIWKETAYENVEIIHVAHFKVLPVMNLSTSYTHGIF
jgi:hypothetical protein